MPLEPVSRFVYFFSRQVPSHRRAHRAGRELDQSNQGCGLAKQETDARV